MIEYRGQSILESRNGIFDGVQKIFVDEIHHRVCDIDNAFANLYRRIKAEVSMQTYFDYCCWQEDYLPNHKWKVYMEMTTVYPDIMWDTFADMWSSAVSAWEKANA